MPAAPAKILLLEDNPSDRQFMDACLQDCGSAMELHHAGRLDEAGSYLRSQRYELVIADLNLPDTEGLDTFFKVKEMASDAAIVVMTGMDDTQLAARAVLAGAQDYLVKGDLAPRRVRQSVSNALQRHSQLLRISGEARDLRKKNNSLRELAYVDTLTGLVNRRGLAKILAQSSTRRSRPLATHALLVDVDDFKKVNDLFGYGRGDLALKELGRRIRALLHSSDIGARIGGDEFLVLTSAADTAEAVSLAECIRASAADAGVQAPGSFKMTVSVGVAALGHRSYVVEELLEVAQGPLKMSKGGGKNRVCFDGETRSKGAGAGHAPAVVRVPFFELRSGRRAGYRFMVPGDAAAPDPASLSVGQVRELVRAAVHDGEGLECHLQLSHGQLLQLRPEDLAVGLDLGPRGLKLSIPAVPMSPLPPGLLEAVRRLQAGGWALALGGLDLGAHVWANLILLEPAAVTLDAGMVTGIASDPERLRGLLRLSRALACLGAYAVAGGVETPEDLEALDDAGIGYGWGSLWKGKQ